MKKKILSFMGTGKSVFGNAKFDQKRKVWDTLDNIRAEKENLRDIDYSGRLQ